MLASAVPFANEQNGAARLQPPAPMSKKSKGQIRSHSDACSYVKKHRESDTMRATAVTPRTIQHWSNPLKDRNLLTKEVARCLRADFAHERSHLKVIARHAEASPRTVEAWVDGVNLPGFEFIARLTPHSPSLQKLYLRLMTLSPDTDPEYFRALQDLRRAIG